MKITIALLILFSAACTSQYNDEISDHAAHDHGIPGLSLNEGEKWNADENTTANVTAMQKQVDDFLSIQQPVMADYKILNESLQQSLNKLIKECRMSGEDHDALHLWLEPLISEVNALGKTNDDEEASASYKTISEILQNYHNFFE